jgi:hypothetical protein
MEGLPTSEFSEHLRTIEYNGARATVDIDDTSATVFIQHLEAAEPGQGAGSQLLNKLKTDFPEYTIEGTAMPLDFDNPYERLHRTKLQTRDHEKTNDDTLQHEISLLADGLLIVSTYIRTAIHTYLLTKTIQGRSFNLLLF